MPKTHFTVDNCTSLDSLPKGARIHVVGVCGVAMAQLSIELAERGYRVTGSDKEFYEPMGGLLKSSKVETFTGYAAENVPAEVDLAIIGNAISYGNPEVDVIEQRNLPYTCFPKILGETLIGDRHSIVVSGTHGKSTTTALIASLLRRLNADPSYFVGGVAQDLPSSFHVGAGTFSVVEGDEYDSAFFAKVPKFTFYRPMSCIVNAIEYDHADIYPDLESIEREFTKLALAVPANGVIYAAIDFPVVERLLPMWREKTAVPIVTFGVHERADVRIVARKQEGFTQSVRAERKDGPPLEFEIPIPGLYNAKNALVSMLTLERCGFPVAGIAEALTHFKPVKRRQEIRFDKGGVTLIEDFAHHPTAVDETLRGIREAFPTRTLWAVFEPRSNTSRRKVFQNDYVRAFKTADRAVLCQVAARAIDTGIQLIDVAELSGEIDKEGTPSVCLPDAAAIEKHVLEQVKNNDVILVMSNGSFGGLIQNLEDRLRERI